jgi:hypothetical protein
LLRLMADRTGPASSPLITTTSRPSVLPR